MMGQKKKVAYRITSCIMALQIVIFAVLYIFMSKTKAEPWFVEPVRIVLPSTSA